MNKMSATIIETPIGKLFASGDDKALHTLSFFENAHDVGLLQREPDALLSIREELDAYFKGTLRAFKTPLKPHGTPFQQAVWKELLNIPYGETISYKDLSRAIGNPNAFRAVGSANGANPIAIVIPCHRVIAADGSIGGYSGGIKIKEALLSLEIGIIRPS